VNSPSSHLAFLYVSPCILVGGCTQASPPTKSPTKKPANLPTKKPRRLPTKAPRKTPVGTPTKAPTRLPACTGGATSWIYDVESNVPTQVLANNTSACLAQPYNIGFRPCNSSVSLEGPIRIRLVNALNGKVVHKSVRQSSDPYLLFGPASPDGDLPESPKRLRNGVYYLSAPKRTGWGRVMFTQDCPPCPKGKKGMMMGCMMA
jgi:hypothetical protein